MKRIELSILVATLMLTPFAASRADHGRDGARMFEGLDANSDGVISRSEAEQGAAERARKLFDSLDADGDGNLTKAEAEQAREKRRTAWREKAEERFRAADANADGSLSREEAEQGLPHVARNFERLDTDRSGGVSADELRGARKSRKE